MQLPYINIHTPTFKAINLTPEEKHTSDDLLKNLSGADGIQADLCKIKLYKLYDKHLQKEVNLKSHKRYIKNDFSQKMFLVFFETVENIRKKIISATELIPIMDKVRPGKDEIKSGISEHSIDAFIPNTDLTYKDTITTENLPIYSTPKNKEEMEIINHEIQKILDTNDLKDIENIILQEKATGKSFQKIASMLSLSPSTIRRIYLRSVAKLQSKNNTLPKNFELFEQTILEKYNLNDYRGKLKKAIIDFPDITSIDTKQLFKNVTLTSELLDISEDEYVKSMIQYPRLFYYKPESVKNNTLTSSHLLGIKEKLFIRSALKYPSLFVYSGKTLNANVENSCKLLNITKSEFTKCALLSPPLFYIKGENLKNNIITTSKLLKIKEEDFFNAGKKHPTLLLTDSKVIDKNISRSSELLDISRENFIKISLRQPQLFYQNPETLKRNAKNSSELLEIKEKEFIKATLKQPQLLYQKPETINANIDKCVEIFNIPRHNYVKLALQHPQLMYQNPYTLKQNMEKSCELLGLSQEEFLLAVRSAPQYLILKPENINQKVKILADTLGVEKTFIAKLLVKYPFMAIQKPENVIKKLNIQKYYKEINGKRNDKLVFYTTTNENQYNRILAYLIKTHFGNKMICQKNLDKYILENPNEYYQFELPKNDLNDEFISYVQKYVENLLGYSNIEFKIKEL